MSKKVNSSYYLTTCRLNGYMELVKFNFAHKKEDKHAQFFHLLSTLRVHDSPITSLAYSENGSYLMTTSQDCLLKIVKINKASSVSLLPSIMGARDDIDEKEELSLMFALSEHDESMITAMCIDQQNTLNAASGSENGVICLWNLFTGQCKFKLLNHKARAHKSPILKLELCQQLLVSLNSEQQMCIWNTSSGELVKEFKFFAPMPSTVSGIYDYGGCQAWVMQTIIYKNTITNAN